MDLRKITEDFSVSPQIAASDIPGIVAAGFKSILCNRPDFEEPNQCCFGDVAEAAEEAGLTVRSVPIISGQIRSQDMVDFKMALDEMPRPVLAYCRSGTRCTMLWTVAKFGEISPEDILRMTGQAGYDMSGIVHQMMNR